MAKARKSKTALSAAKPEFEPFLKKLLALRARLTGDVAHLTDEAFREASESSQPNHIAELGSDVYEQDITLQVLQSEENVLTEINEAIARIQKGTYGICEMSKKPIPKARLNAIPWTRYRVECAKIVERGD
jgi:DnaK suppressor protein